MRSRTIRSAFKPVFGHRRLAIVVTLLFYRIDHEASAHDDRVISLALAAHRLVTTSAKPKVDRKKLAAAMARSTAELWKPSGRTLDY